MSTPRITSYLVLGAGPAGTVLAIRLAQAGHAVLVVDANPEPLAEVGESLLPWCSRVLDALDIDMSGFQVKPGAVFAQGSLAARFPFEEAARTTYDHAWQVPRDEFDRRLRERAVEAGVEFLWAKVSGITLPGQVQTDQGEIHADFIVDAMGRRQVLARQLGLRVAHPRLRNLAMGTHFTGVDVAPPAQAGDITITPFAGGWFWFIPFLDGRHSVGMVATPEAGLSGDRWAEGLARCPDARARLAHATRVGPMRGHQDFTASSRRFHGDGWALAGDAALFLDPVFSSGILVALECADRLADALIATHGAERGPALDAWEAALRAAVKPMEQAVLAFYDGSFLEVAFCPPELQPARYRQAIVGLLAGDLFTPGNERVVEVAGKFGEIASLVRRTLERRAERARP